MNKKKLWGAILSGGLFVLYFAFFFIVFTFAGVLTGDIPLVALIITMIILLIPLFGISLALIMRVREIKGGEEEEAKKY